MMDNIYEERIEFVVRVQEVPWANGDGSNFVGKAFIVGDDLPLYSSPATHSAQAAAHLTKQNLSTLLGEMIGLHERRYESWTTRPWVSL